MLTFVARNHSHTLAVCSLSGNKLCGVYTTEEDSRDDNGDPLTRFETKGTYNADGFTELLEGLKGSAIKSLK